MLCFILCLVPKILIEENGSYGTGPEPGLLGKSELDQYLKFNFTTSSTSKKHQIRNSRNWVLLIHDLIDFTRVLPIF
jgi:hypothetical protein